MDSDVRPTETSYPVNDPVNDEHYLPVIDTCDVLNLSFCVVNEFSYMGAVSAMGKKRIADVRICGCRIS